MTPDMPGQTLFGTLPDGSPVTRVTLARAGTTARFITWGASLQEFRLDEIDRALNLGADNLAAYIWEMRYFGAVVGPVANRIAAGRMTLDGTTHALDRNEEGITTLHSGAKGFSFRNWTVQDSAPDRVTFALVHPDGMGGFPGPIDVAVTYSLDADGALVIEITGASPRLTAFSPAFHGYWNLSGAAHVTDHALSVNASHYLPVDASGIPLGAPAPVAGTHFDHRSPHSLEGAVDHNYCLDGWNGDVAPACQLRAGGLVLDVATDQPGVQIYDAGHNKITDMPGLQGRPYGPLSGLAIEPQFWPDHVNHPDYPQSLLRPGEVYRQTSRFHVYRG